MSMHLHLTVYSHHFVVNRLSYRAKNACFAFTNNLIQWSMVPERGRMVRKPTKTYTGSTADKSEFRFHINHLKKFLELLVRHHIPPPLYTVEIKPLYTAAKVNLTIQPKWTDRDYQVGIIEYLSTLKSDVDYVNDRAVLSKFLSLQTGKGKSYSTMRAIAEMGMRSLFIIRPMFIQKWVEDLERTYELERGDVLVIQGSGQLLAMLDAASKGTLTAKIILLSNRTYQAWLKLYELYGAESKMHGYPCYPHEIYEWVGAGIKVVDECHMDIHLVTRMDLYTHVHTSISLSATLLSQDPFLTEVYKTLYPYASRYKEIELDRYADAYAVHFDYENVDSIRTTENGSTNFSNNAIEDSILKSAKMLKNYCSLLDYVIEIGFLQCQRPVKKLLIFGYSVVMLDALIDHVRKKYGHEFRCKRYAPSTSDPWSHLMDSDICVTTVGAAGTAVDVPNLTNCILTISINSLQANIQAIGRLRKLEPGVNVEFHYYVATNIPKSLQYHENKKNIFSHRVRQLRNIYSGHIV